MEHEVSKFLGGNGALVILTYGVGKFSPRLAPAPKASLRGMPPIRGGAPKVIQTGGHTIRESTRKALGMTREEVKQAIEGLKKSRGLGSAQHSHKIYDNGDMVDANTAEYIGNLKEFAKRARRTDT
jgi:hypothetical protein